MSNDQVPNDGTTEESLDDFAAELFGGKTEAPDNAKSEETYEDDPEVNGESDTDTEDTQNLEEDDTLAQEEDEDSDDGNDVDQKPKKKNRFQERIDELTAARKEAERKADERVAEKERELAELRAQLEGNKNEPTDNKPKDDSTELKAPRADDIDQNGKPKYPLGEYDPKFMRDTVEHMFAEREVKAQEQQKLTQEQREVQAAKAELQGQWNTKLDDARERYPDFQQKGEQMLTVFEGIDEQYGEYLTTTLMELDNGPDVFYYLANNVEEAQAIVAQGPKKATIALAKLEAQLSGGKPSQPARRVSQAKTPPPQNKGSAVAKPKVAPDTDDLGAFEKTLFRK